MAEKAPLPTFPFPPPGSRFILITRTTDVPSVVQSSDPTLADPMVMVETLRTVADRLAAGSSGAVLLG